MEVDEPLKGLRGISKIKRHVGKLKKSEWGGYSCLWYAFGHYRGLAINLHEVNFWKGLHAVEVGGKILKKWRKISVTDSYRIKGAIVPTWSP